MGHFFDVAFYQPIFNGLMALLRVLPGHDLGLAIIGLTIVIRLVLIWPSMSQIRSSRSLQQLQPKLKALQKEFGSNKEEYAKRVMALYKEHKVNPFSSCLPTLIQLPFLFALYRVFVSGLAVDPTTHLVNQAHIDQLYAPLRDFFLTTPIRTFSLGLIDLVGKHNYILAAIVGITQFFQVKMLTPKTNPPGVKGAQDEQLATAMTKQTMYLFPALFAWITWTVPSGLGLYFVVSNVFSIVQQWFVMRKDKPTTTLPAQP